MNIGVIGNITKQSLPDAVGTLLQLGEVYGLKYFIHNDLQNLLARLAGQSGDQAQFVAADVLVKESDIVVAFGGDGTILSAARMVGDRQIPILGINLGKLGFLAESSLEELENFIADITKNHHTVEERTVLKTMLEHDQTEMFALNEVVVDKSTSSRVIRISVYVNDDYLVSYSGDGIIVSTPTGSTGYALAAGAPIMVPTTNVFVLQPISAHSLSARTVIVPDSSIIKIVVEHHSEEARVTADGQQEVVFNPPKNIYVSKANYKVRLIKRKDRSYYDVLRAKLLWGSDVRLVKGTKE